MCQLLRNVELSYKVTEQSVCFGHGGVTAFTERRVTGVLHTTILSSFTVRYSPASIKYRHLQFELPKTFQSHYIMFIYVM